MTDPMDRVADAIRGEFERLQARIEQLEAALDDLLSAFVVTHGPGGPTVAVANDRILFVALENARSTARNHANCAGAAKSLAGETGGDT